MANPLFTNDAVLLGYAVGTYGAWFCGMLMQVISH